MRIRTIKPEFWSHPVMVRLPDDTRLLAIALLNYADDEGYFYADPDLVQGALMPKKKSTSVRRALDELSSVGYLEVVEHPSHGPLGHIVSFSDHQRVDRRKPSTIKQLHSSIDRRAVDEGSTLEGKGKEQGREEYPPNPPRGKRPSKARPQSCEEVEEFAEELGLPKSDGSAFWDAKEGNGWKNGKNLVKDWKATFRNWKHNGYHPSQNPKKKPTNGVTRHVDTRQTKVWKLEE